MADRVCVIGIGNTLMGDDGVGVRVAELAAHSLAGEPRAGVVTGGTAGMALMPHVLGADAVVFVDAVASGEEPGAIYRFDPDEAGVMQTRSHTSHGVGIPYLVTTARLQGHRPTVVVFGVNIADTMLGPDTLSPLVKAAVPRVVEMVAEETKRLLAGE